MFEYKVGKVVKEFKNNRNALLFNFGNDGCTLCLFLEEPEPDEIAQFGSGNKFEIRFMETGSVIMITAKFGNIEWFEAPYSPHLNRTLPEIAEVGENQGLALQAMLVDSTTGEIKAIRLISLSEHFSKQFLKAVKYQMGQGFNVREYDNTINKIYNIYSTEEIAKISKNYFRIGY